MKVDLPKKEVHNLEYGEEDSDAEPLPDDPLLAAATKEMTEAKKAFEAA